MGNPQFSVQGKVFDIDTSIDLGMSIPENSPDDTEIRYTIDGSEPTEQSYLYTEPITINKNTTIRAKLFCNGYLSPRSSTQSYLFHGREVTLPVISIVSDQKYFNDSIIGILVRGRYSANLQNYMYNWRRPINFEFFSEKNKNSDINQLCETRVGGNSTRIYPLKSLIIYANKRFGEKRLQYEFFPDQRPKVTDFKSIMLRNSGDDFGMLYMRDAIVSHSMAPYVDMDMQSWSPAIIYINGEYKGILNIRDRSNEDYVFTYYGGLENIDMVEGWHDLKAGDWDNYNQFMSFVEEDDHTWKEYEKWLDVNEFLNLMIMNLFYNNLDFPGKNIMMWRPKTEEGRWRFIAKDADYSLGLYGITPDYNIFEWIYNPDYDEQFNWGANSNQRTLLFRQLMKDERFRNAFIDRSTVYMGDFLRENVVRKMWDKMYDKVKYEMPYHRKNIEKIERYFKYESDYLVELNFAQNWLHNRYKAHYNNLADFFNLGNPCPLVINQDSSEDTIDININGIKLQTGRFDGFFYANRHVTLESHPQNTNYIVNGWKIYLQKNDLEIDSVAYGESISFEMPQCLRLVLTPFTEKANIIQNPSTDEQFEISIDSHNIKISNVMEGTRVLLYDMKGLVISEKFATKNRINIPYRNKGLFLLKIGHKIIKVFK